MSQYPAAERQNGNGIFALRFLRLLRKMEVARTLGTDGCWLLTLIAEMEDRTGYTRAVTFFNDELKYEIRLSLAQLDRVRKKCIDAGWLHYEQGWKGIAGKYWVTIPACALDQHQSGFPPHTEKETERESAFPPPYEDTSGRKAGGKREESINHSSLLPNPNPKDSGPSSATGPNPAKPKKANANKPDGSPQPFPFTSEAFKTAWSKWEGHRKQKRATLTPNTIEQQFKEMSAWGEERSIAAIYHSIGKGWTGLFEPDAPKADAQPAPQYRKAGQRPKDDK